MATRLHLAVAALAGCVLVAVPGYAQDPAAPAPAPAPANLAYIDGDVNVVQQGVSEPADPPLMLLDGDVVRTRNGRAEIVFGDGSLLHLSHDSELEILGEEHLRLLRGRAIVRVSDAAARSYVIDTPASSVRLQGRGEYGVMTDETARLEVTVARGSASLDDRWTIGSGHKLTILGAGGRPLVEPFNSARWDAFAQWSYDRANGFAASASAGRLPYELRPYGPVLDRYGHWGHVAPHGYVWFPSVAVGWRPYFDGWWLHTRFGWTWRGRHPWAWPTHHYGRWGFTGSLWYWIPAPGWAPAWVLFSITSGYVSWAPLGWHGHPVFGFRRDHPAYFPHYNPWRGWTVVPRRHFGPRRHVRVHAIDGDRLDPGVRDAIARAVPISTGNDRAVPVSPRRDVAVPRGGAVRGGVDRAVPVRRLTSDRATFGASSAAGARRAPDNPAYAPPRAWTSGSAVSATADEAREAGRARQPDTARERDGARVMPPTLGRTTRSGAVRGGVRNPAAAERTPPSAEPRVAAPPPSAGAPSRGAVERRSIREPRGTIRSVPRHEPRTVSPPPAGRPGGAVERSGAVRRAPGAAVRSGGDAPRASSPSGRTSSGTNGAAGSGGARRRPPR